MPSSPSSSLPTWWLHIWIAVGAVAFALLIIVPMLMFSTFSRERYRFDQCEAHRRDDCKPSMIWYLSGWMVLEPKAGANSSSTSMTASSTGMVASSTQDTIVTGRETKTSDKAPQMLVIQPKGFTIVNGVYMAAAGTSTSWTVEVKDVTSVELYYLPEGAKAGTQKRVATLKKQSEGLYAGNWTMTKAVKGEIEVRANGAKKEYGSLFYPVAVRP